MKTLILTASLVASILAGALNAQASERFDAAKFFEDIARRASQ